MVWNTGRQQFSDDCSVHARGCRRKHDGPWYKYLHLKEMGLFIAFLIAIHKFALHPVVCIIAARILGIVLKL